MSIVYSSGLGLQRTGVRVLRVLIYTESAGNQRVLQAERVEELEWKKKAGTK